VYIIYCQSEHGAGWNTVSLTLEFQGEMPAQGPPLGVGKREVVVDVVVSLAVVLIEVLAVVVARVLVEDNVVGSCMLLRMFAHLLLGNLQNRRKTRAKEYDLRTYRMWFGEPSSDPKVSAAAFTSDWSPTLSCESSQNIVPPYPLAFTMSVFILTMLGVSYVTHSLLIGSYENAVTSVLFW